MDKELRLFSFIFIPLQAILLTIIQYIIFAKVLKKNKVETKINRILYKYVRCINKFVLFPVKKTKSKGLPMNSNYLLGGAELKSVLR